MKHAFLFIALSVLGRVVSAEVMVSPPQSKPGITQRYELRVHDEGTVVTTAVDLQIPDGVTVLSVENPFAGTVDIMRMVDRITAISWNLEVEPGRDVALKFEARNPSDRTDVHWNVLQHLADGSIVAWSDAPGSAEQALVTAITGSRPARRSHGD